MINTIEAATSTIKTVGFNMLQPKTVLSKENVSPKSQLALQVAAELAFKEQASTDPELYRQLSNLIYYANNYFDIGLTMRAKLFENKPGKFEALHHIYSNTKQKMEAAAEELKESHPELSELVR